ncbi:hypothetical protein ACFU5Y_34060 [Streptomyces gardneri]|uniref:hypothetical protein n=1 Tax=Streptomyces gardneri TaxID=66892 RepID=UPI0036C5F8C2
MCRPHGHQDTERSGGGSCDTIPHYPVHIRHGYYAGEGEYHRAQHDQWWLSLTPEQHDEEEARYWEEMAADTTDPGFDADLDDEGDYRDDWRPGHHKTAPCRTSRMGVMRWRRARCTAHGD